MKRVSKVIGLLLLLGLSACSSMQSSPFPTPDASFEIGLASDRGEIREGEPFKLLLSARNTSDEPVEFWSLSCGPGINWSIDNPLLERVDIPAQCAKNVPTIIYLQPGDTFQDIAMVNVKAGALSGPTKMRIGFAPWLSREQLLNWSNKTIGLEEVKKMTFWSNPLYLEVGVPSFSKTVTPKRLH